MVDLVAHEPLSGWTSHPNLKEGQMADLAVHEPLSLEELHAETCMALPERDLMQNVVIGGNAQANAAGDYAIAVATGILVVPGP
jgi:hypothetical protein